MHEHDVNPIKHDAPLITTSYKSIFKCK